MLEAALGEPVAFDDSLSGLQRGDLVFWKGHVGIMTDPDTLLHATAYTMTVMSEPLRVARDRIQAKSFGAITSIRRRLASERFLAKIANPAMVACDRRPPWRR